MKVIKDNYTRTFKCTCPNCKSVFEFTQNEAIVGSDVTIYCPLCKESIFLATKKTDQFVNVVEVKKAEKKSATTSKKTSKEVK